MNDERMRVIGRVRPFSRAELLKKEDSVISTSGRCMSVKQVGQNSPGRVGGVKNFKLDCVLDERSTQSDVFCQVEPLLQFSLDGYNTTVFTYGQSGTGKTYSMLGYDLWAMARDSLQKFSNNNINNNKENRLLLHSAVLELATDEESIGIIPRSMEWLFQQTHTLSQRRIDVKISVSYVEIHNERLIDLLIPVESKNNSAQSSPNRSSSSMNQNNVSAPKQSLDIREVNGDIFVVGLTLIEVQSAAEVLEILWTGARARSIAATDLNEYSSRSHTIFQAHLELFDREANEITHSKISLVDLAGSEKLKAHHMVNFSQEHIRELTSINRSLSSLSNCISALLQRTRVHVPYRDSKLTRLLQDSLGGNTQTVFVVTLSPSLSCYDETVSTLQFADRAMKVAVQANPNKSNINSQEKNSSAELEICKGEIIQLKKMIEYLITKNGDSNTSVNLNDKNNGGNLNHPRYMKNLIDNEENPRSQAFHLESEQMHNQSSISHLKSLVRALRSENTNEDDINEDTDNINNKDQNSHNDSSNRLSDSGLLTSKSSLLYPSTNVTSDRNNDLGSNADDNVDLGTNQDDNNDAKIDAAIQFEILLKQSTDIERRRADLDGIEKEEEGSSEWLHEYHAWLLSRAKIRAKSDLHLKKEINNEKTSIDFSNTNNNTLITKPVNDTSMNKNEIGEGLFDRICMMEMSVLIQAEELTRAKKLFLEKNSELRMKLNDSSKENDRLMMDLDIKTRRKSEPDLRLLKASLSQRASSPQLALVPSSSSNLHNQSNSIKKSKSSDNSIQKSKSSESPRNGSDRSLSQSPFTRLSFEDSNCGLNGSDNKGVEMEGFDEDEEGDVIENDKKFMDHESNTNDDSFEYDVYPTLMSIECHKSEYDVDNNSKINVAVLNGNTDPSLAEEKKNSVTTHPGHPREPKAHKRRTLWGEYTDPTSGLRYYHNRQTKETFWERPSEEDMMKVLPAKESS